MIALFTHPTAVGARKVTGGWALVDEDGDTVDVVSGPELHKLCEADDAALQEELG